MAGSRLDPEAVFFAAQRLPRQDRTAYLDEGCADDPALRQRSEQFLSAQAETGSFLEGPVVPLLTANAHPVPEGAGTVIGPYRLMEQIGEGGMGLVFVAEQQEPVRRKVALKV